MNYHEEINEYYKNNPPKITFDDIGIHVPVQVPLPAKYVKQPCKCGIIHKWEEGTFYIDELELLIGFLPKRIKKCKVCQDVLMLELYREEE